jgi:hypothetical protein
MWVNRSETVYYDIVLFRYTNCKIKEFTLHINDINLKIVWRYFFSDDALYFDKFLEIILLKIRR